MNPYTDDYYKNLRKGSGQSAREIIPMVLEMVQPKSVIEVGCGTGTWLSVFKEFGIEDCFGVDGPWVDRKMIEIPQDQFLSFDLQNPFRMDRRFDLVVSLEVAEHLPQECAAVFVDTLTRLGPIILFSAAIPFQGGTKHINEQWPEYWIEYFHQKDYQVIDCIRKKIWNNDKVEWWYAQNIFIFYKTDCSEYYSVLKRGLKNENDFPISVVHPKNYLRMMLWRESVHLASQEIGTMISLDEAFILVDEQQFGNEIKAGRHWIPFLEREGSYYGPPSNDITAIQELERQRQSGASFIVFGWPAFWWLDYYSGFFNYLHTRFRCILKNDRLVVFDLRK